MLPVLDGTRKIVPVEADDSLNKLHQSFEQWLADLERQRAALGLPPISPATAPQNADEQTKTYSPPPPYQETPKAIQRANPRKHGPITIETVTPGDDRPVVPEFLTGALSGNVSHDPSLKPMLPAGADKARTITITRHPGEQYLWIDHQGNKHPTDKARAKANRMLEAKRRKRKGGAK